MHTACFTLASFGVTTIKFISTHSVHGQRVHYWLSWMKQKLMSVSTSNKTLLSIFISQQLLCMTTIKCDKESHRRWLTIIMHAYLIANEVFIHFWKHINVCKDSQADIFPDFNHHTLCCRHVLLISNRSIFATKLVVPTANWIRNPLILITVANQICFRIIS